MPLGALGKYERIDVLGHGATGIVYLAKDTLLDRLVALKEVPAESTERDRYLAEARALDRLRHPNIVSIHGVSEIGSKLIIDMEFVHGRNLQDILRRQPRLEIADALSIVTQICDGLAYAHSQRTVHRDVKPANIIVAQDGEVKLVDFGLAEVLGTNSFAPGAGTYAYMAPEDFNEEELSNRQSDIWAVGVILYEILAGHRPFQVANIRDPFSWRRAIEKDCIEPIKGARPDIPDGVQAILDKALARELSDRYENASDMAADLRALGVAQGPQSLKSFATVYARPEVDADAPTIAAVRPESEAETIAAVSGPPAAIPNMPPLSHIDQFLAAAPDQWMAAREALLGGSLARWLRSIGEYPLATVADTIAAQTGADDDTRLRDFLYRAGLDTADVARTAYSTGIQFDQHGRYGEASDLLRRAVRLDPSIPAYHLQLARALRQTGDSVASALALEEGISHHPKDRALSREHVQATSNGVTITPAALDFGSIRQGESRMARVGLKNTGATVLEGHIASMPGWIKVEPARFSTRQRQPLTITADASNVWQAAAEYTDKVVLETSAGRRVIDIRMSVLPALRRLRDIFWWYLPALLFAMLPASIAIVRGERHPWSMGNFWEPGMMDSGLLCVSLFVLAVAAQTVWPWRAVPILLVLVSLTGPLAMASSSMSDPRAHVAQVGLWETTPPIIVMLVLQGISTLRDPKRWGRWQLWAIILAATSIITTETLIHVQP